MSVELDIMRVSCATTSIYDKQIYLPHPSLQISTCQSAVFWLSTALKKVWNSPHFFLPTRFVKHVSNEREQLLRSFIWLDTVQVVACLSCVNQVKNSCSLEVVSSPCSTSFEVTPVCWLDCDNGLILIGYLLQTREVMVTRQLTLWYDFRLVIYSYFWFLGW